MTYSKANYHGMTGTRQWISWRDMIQRCCNPKHAKYPNYGGRGIRICEKWLAGFYWFWEDMGSTYLDGLTIDRIDNDGDYEISNCRWVTFSQNSSHRRDVRYIDINGVRKSIERWAIILRIRPSTLRKRILKQNIAPEIAIAMPFKSQNPRP